MSRVLSSRMKKHKCLWYKRESIDFEGNDVFGLPTVIKCRWDESSSEQYSDFEQTRRINATVWLIENVKQGDVLYRKDNWTDCTTDLDILSSITEELKLDPTKSSETRKVVSVDDSPLFRGNVKDRKVTL